MNRRANQDLGTWEGRDLSANRSNNGGSLLQGGSAWLAFPLPDSLPHFLCVERSRSSFPKGANAGWKKPPRSWMGPSQPIQWRRGAWKVGLVTSLGSPKSDFASPLAGSLLILQSKEESPLLLPPSLSVREENRRKHKQVAQWGTGQ